MNVDPLPGVQIDPYVRELADALIGTGVVSKDSTEELAPRKLAEAFLQAVKVCREGNRRQPDYSDLWEE